MTQVTCQSFWVTDGFGGVTMCPSAPASLGTSETGCRWRIHGGMDQAAHTVGLASSGGPAADSSVCNPRMGIIPGGTEPRRDRIVLQKDLTNGTSELYEVHVEPVVQSVCPDEGFDCGLIFPPGG